MNECMNNGMTRQQLQDQIKAFDFALIEMNLYLDTHPCDKEALQLTGVYRSKRDLLIETFERRFGPWAITADKTPTDGEKWTWVNDPWPWEYM